MCLAENATRHSCTPIDAAGNHAFKQSQTDSLVNILYTPFLLSKYHCIHVTSFDGLHPRDSHQGPCAVFCRLNRFPSIQVQFFAYTRFLFGEICRDPLSSLSAMGYVWNDFTMICFRQQWACTRHCGAFSSQLWHLGLGVAILAFLASLLASTCLIQAHLS